MQSKFLSKDLQNKHRYYASSSDEEYLETYQYHSKLTKLSPQKSNQQLKLIRKQSDLTLHNSMKDPKSPQYTTQMHVAEKSQDVKNFTAKTKLFRTNSKGASEHDSDDLDQNTKNSIEWKQDTSSFRSSKHEFKNNLKQTNNVDSIAKNQQDTIIQELRAENEELKQSISDCRNMIATMQSQIDQLTHKLKETDEELTKINHSLKKCDDKCEIFSESMLKQEQNQTLQAENNQKLVNQLTDIKDDQILIKSQIAQLQQTSVLEENFGDQKSQINRLATTVQEVQTQQAEITQSQNNTNISLHNLKHEINNIQTFMQQLVQMLQNLQEASGQNTNLSQIIQQLKTSIDQQHEVLNKEIIYLNETTFQPMYTAFINKLQQKINQLYGPIKSFYESILNQTKGLTYTRFCKLFGIQSIESAQQLATNVILSWSNSGSINNIIRETQQLSVTTQILQSVLANELKKVSIWIDVSFGSNNEIQLGNQPISKALWRDLFITQITLGQKNIACAINLTYYNKIQDVLVVFDGKNQVLTASGTEQCIALAQSLGDNEYHVLVRSNDQNLLNIIARKKIVVLNIIRRKNNIAINLSFPTELKYAYVLGQDIANICECKNLMTIVYCSCMETYLQTALEGKNVKIFEFS